MPKVKRNTDVAIKLACDDPDDTFIVRHTNAGEPFREGIEIGIENDDWDKSLTVMLENRSAIELRDLLLAHYPLNTKL